MKRIHIIGRKNSGKTTLVAELVAHLSQQGVVVGTVKHTHHQHELDTPGKDSHRHREAGARVVGILSPDLNAVFFQPEQAHDAPERYDAIAPMFAQCDIVLVEGHSHTTAAKVEVWRAANDRPAMALEDPAILAVVTDDPLEANVTLLARSDIAALADQLMQWAG